MADIEDITADFIHAISNKKTKAKYKLIPKFEDSIFPKDGTPPPKLSQEVIACILEGDLSPGSKGIVMLAGEKPKSKRSAVVALHLLWRLLFEHP